MQPPAVSNPSSLDTAAQPPVVLPLHLSRAQEVGHCKIQQLQKSIPTFLHHHIFAESFKFTNSVQARNCSAHKATCVNHHTGLATAKTTSCSLARPTLIHSLYANAFCAAWKNLGLANYLTTPYIKISQHSYLQHPCVKHLQSFIVNE